MKQNILITGGTSGIGAALAKFYTQEQQVFVTGSKSQSQIPTEAHYIVADQHNADGATEAVFGALKAANTNSLDLAILNAGVGFWRGPKSETREEIRATLTVNLMATMALAHRLFPLLAAANGTLVLIGSTSHKGNANLATYAASKAALDGFARSLRSEWQGRVRVQIIHPGPTATPMHSKAGLDTGKAGALFASADTSAAMIIDAIGKGRLRTTLNPMQRLLHLITKWARP